MEALVRSSTMIFSGKTLLPTRTLLGQSGVDFSRSLNPSSNVRYVPSFSLQNRTIQLTSDSPSSNLSHQTEAWAGFEEGAHGMQESQPWKTVHVRFELKKECCYGENFFLVGDDPMIGSWDPARALPLNWSDGHVWTLEPDMPVDVPIQFKLILQQNDQDLVWQPGPDRILRTWDTKDTIVISENWENVESQKLSEDQNMNHNVNQMHIVNRDSMPKNDRNREDDPISSPEEESLFDAKIETFVVDGDAHWKDESMVDA